MKSISIAIIAMAAVALAACGRKSDDRQAAAPAQAARAQLAPNPPMSATDIDSIVAESRRSDASRRRAAIPAGAPTPASTVAAPATPGSGK